jgi:preprotein translocase subunit SecD
VATKSSTPVRKAGRSLAWLGAIIAVLAAIVAGNSIFGTWQPGFKLALDLSGGTQIILAPLIADETDVSAEELEQAVAIIRQRVDATGVAEAEISTLGNNIVVAIPGTPDQATLDRIQASAKLEFRAVLLADVPSNSTAAPTRRRPPRTRPLTLQRPATPQRRPRSNRPTAVTSTGSPPTCRRSSTRSTVRRSTRRRRTWPIPTCRS